MYFGSALAQADVRNASRCRPVNMSTFKPQVERRYRNHVIGVVVISGEQHLDLVVIGLLPTKGSPSTAI
jgi:hypothetical protein